MMMNPMFPPIWLEEPDYAKSYARGISNGILEGYGAPLDLSAEETSPAYHRGLEAGYRVTRAVTKRRRTQ